MTLPARRAWTLATALAVLSAFLLAVAFPAPLAPRREGQAAISVSHEVSKLVVSRPAAKLVADDAVRRVIDPAIVPFLPQPSRDFTVAPALVTHVLRAFVAPALARDNPRTTPKLSRAPPVA